MQFPFAVNTLFPRNIVKLGRELVPDGFTGSRREYEEAVIKISRVLDELGRASAEAQGLNLPITSAERLRNSNHTVYIFTDPDGAQGNGCIVGLLKVGRKNLFLFDETGAHYEMQALCVLDFYIHESKQRIGYGLILYGYMLRQENISPQHLAIDRPSLKFLKFMQKHYGLEKILPQSNNFVVFDGFFTDRPDPPNKSRLRMNAESLPAGITQTTCSLKRIDNTSMQHDEVCSPQSTGRFAAYNPPSTLGKIFETDTVNSYQRKGDHANVQQDQECSLQSTGRFAAYNPPSTLGKIFETGIVNSFQRKGDHTDVQQDQECSLQSTGRFAAYNPPSTMGKIFETGTVNSYRKNGHETNIQHVGVNSQQNGSSCAAYSPPTVTSQP